MYRSVLLVKAVSLTLILVVGLAPTSVADSKPVRTAVGITLGTPAGINLSVMQFVSAESGFQCSGAYWPGRGDARLFGAEIGYLKKTETTKNGFFALTVLVGFSKIEGCCDRSRWTYGAIGYAGMYRRLMGELVLTVGDGDYRSPQLGLNIGLALYRVRK